MGDASGVGAIFRGEKESARARERARARARERKREGERERGREGARERGREREKGRVREGGREEGREGESARGAACPESGLSLEYVLTKRHFQALNSIPRYVVSRIQETPLPLQEPTGVPHS